MLTRTRASIALLAAVAAVAAGCGSSERKGPTRADFVAKAEAVCEDVNGQLRRLGQPSDVAGFVAAATRSVAITSAGEERLREIEAPAELADGYERLIGLLEQQTAALRRIGAAARAGDDAGIRAAAADSERASGEQDGVARTLGLDACGKGNA